MTRAELSVGIDLGTQSVRVVVIDTTGVVRGTGRQHLTSIRNGDRHEQDPMSWWNAVTRSVREALRDIDRSAVRAVSVCGTSGTVLVADRNTLQPLTPALMYDDRRAAAQVPEVNAAGEAVWQRLGYRRMQAVWGLPKLLHLLATCPDAAGGVLMHQADVVTSRLLGRVAATDTSNALKSGCDGAAVRWPAEVFSTLGIPDQLLPDLVLPGTAIGTICREAAELTGLPAGTVVVAGLTDGCAAQVASGALRVGDCNSVLGTTLVLKTVSSSPLSDEAGVVYSHRSPDGPWWPGGASSVGTGALSALLPGADAAALDHEAMANVNARVPLCYPLAGESGERFPFLAPDAHLFMEPAPSNDVEAYQAVMRGIALVERLCHDYLGFLGADRAGSYRLTGGGSASAYARVARATILDRVVEVPAVQEPAMGMAMLAGRHAGDAWHPEDDLDDIADRMVTVVDRVEPAAQLRAELHDDYGRLLDRLEQRGWLSTPTAAAARKDLQA